MEEELEEAEEEISQFSWLLLCQAISPTLMPVIERWSLVLGSPK